MKVQTLNADERAVWEVLGSHIGPEHPITAAQISEGIPFGFNPLRSRAVRDVIRKMILRDACPLPVVGAGNGYYVMADETMIRRYALRLHSLALKILEREKWVMETARRRGLFQEEEEQGQDQLEMVL